VTSVSGVTTTQAASVAQAAGWAQALGTRLEGMHEDLDAEWRDEVATGWAFADVLAPAQRRRVMPRLWMDRLGGLPRLERLADPLARLCLLQRAEVLSRLCTLAIAQRPGVLRCCIDRAARTRLRTALGASFEPLMVISRHGKAVDESVAAWSPLVWACIGWADWSAALAPSDGAVRELVRLSLPRKMLHDLAVSVAVPADRPVAAAIEALEEAGVAWPC
jgi:hypothetical protein